ncbi:uncharacterized protein LOC128997721 [Macrosteles quadrilineatus]|uniref:uncharacterized protein LOC128997721 n=1 Tax=Macrosteles quadrilineatus TaxID=74068 RepID=UPI0023E0CB1E|nr:uncharacterized protein LOC128997721 [Macrosteles quadrilineatus]
MAKNSTYYECYEPMIHHRPPVNSSFNASSDSSDEGSPTNASSVFVNVNGSLGLYDKYPRQEFLDFDYVEEDRIMMESENNAVIDTTANSSGLNATSEENTNKNGLRLVDNIGPHFDKNVTVSHVIPENQNAATFVVEDETDEDFESFYFEDTF